MQSPTRGSLTAISFIELLKDAAESGLTGMLRVEPATFVKVVYFQDGTIAFASSNEKSDRLTEVLRLAGKLTPEQVEDAQARLKPNVSLGKTLVELGYLSPRDLLWGARAQVEGIIHHLLFLAEGNYQILAGSLPREIIKLNLPVPQVIFEGILKCQDRRWVLQHIESPEAMYTLSPDFHEKYSRYNLSADAVISRVDGKRTLDEIAHLAGIDTFEVCKTAVALQSLGLARRAPLQMPLQEPEQPMEQESVTSKKNEQEFPPAETESEENVSLGEVVQIPTVEDLHKETGEIEHQQEPPGSFLPEPAHEEPAPEESASPAKPIPAITPEPGYFEPASSEPGRLHLSGGRTAETEEAPDRTPSTWTLSWRNIALISLLVLISVSAAYHWLGGKRQSKFRTQDPSSADKPAAAMAVEQTTSMPNNQTPGTKDGIESGADTNAQATSAVPVAESQVPAALALLQSGRIPQAAFAWKQETADKKSKFTIQLMIACQEKTVLEALQTVPDVQKFLILPLRYQGQSCYRILYGLYDSEQEAQSTATGLPPIFLQQVSPAQAVSLRKIWK